MSPRVVPSDQRACAEKTDARVLYALVPADPLPTVDLSVSIKSRVVKKSWQPAMTRLLRRGKTIFAMYAVGNVVGTVVLTCDARIGRALGVVTFFLQLPAPLTGLSLLRFYMVCELVRTFDFWFFFITTTLAIVLFCAQLADGRVWVVFTTWLCMIPNMLIDANLHGASRMAKSNSLAIAACAVLLAVMKFSEIDEANNFAVFRQGKRSLQSADFVFDGIVTMIALLARNVVRLRAAMSSRSGSHEITCVSYRSVLRVVETAHSEPDTMHHFPSRVFTKRQRKASTPSLDYVQRLTLKADSEAIEGGRVLWQRLSFRITLGGRWMRRAYQCSAWGGFAWSTILSVVFSIGDAPSSDALVGVSVTAFVWVLCFVTTTAASYQPQLLWNLLTSFDFLYLSAQISVIHLTACDFCEWNTGRCLAVVASWLWIHWALCIDAVSPLLKDTIRVHVRFPAVVLTISALNSIVLVYAVVMLDTAEMPYNRSVPLFEAKVSVDVLPIFCNSLATVLFFSTRLLYRAWTFSGDKLLLLEGQVVYQNFLANAKLTRKALAVGPTSHSVGEKSDHGHS